MLLQVCRWIAYALFMCLEFVEHMTQAYGEWRHGTQWSDSTGAVTTKKETHA